MGLFGPEWDSRNLEKAKAAVDKLTDQAELERVVTKARYAVVQRMAIDKLTNQNVLIDIAKNGSRPDLRSSAVYNEHLTDREVLADIARTDKDTDVRWYAKKRLEEMRKQENESMNETRKAEVQKMQDPAALANIAKTDYSDDIREAAILNRYLTDQSVFAHIARHDPVESLRIAAIRRITDTAVLDTIKDAYCNKGKHIWRLSTKVRSNEVAMHLHFDRLSVYECAICGLEETRPD